MKLGGGNVATSHPVFEVDLARDVRTVEAMAANLTPYIYEDDLFGILPGDLPRLTLGGLLMRVARLDVLSDRLPEPQRRAAETARHSLGEVRDKWRVHFEKKVVQELRSRMVHLHQFLKEAQENPHRIAPDCPSAMEKRVIVELLKDEATDLGVWTPELANTLYVIDSQIRHLGEQREFIWDPAVESAYPKDKFWFLYMGPCGARR
jgi:hypothetical protein